MIWQIPSNQNPVNSKQPHSGCLALQAYRKNPRVTLQFAVIGINAGRYFPLVLPTRHV